MKRAATVDRQWRSAQRSAAEQSQANYWRATESRQDPQRVSSAIATSQFQTVDASQGRRGAGRRTSGCRRPVAPRHRADQNRRQRCHPMLPTIFRCSIRARVFQLLKQQYSRYTPEMVERITGIPKDQFLKAADLFTSIRKDGDMKKAGDDHLRGRLDAAHLRHADHSHRGDSAIAARQRRSRRWRRERIARPLEHSGRDRHGRRLRHLSRLSEDPAPDRYRSRDFPEAHDADPFEAERMGLVQLLVEHAEVHGVVSEGAVRRLGEKGERLQLSLSAKDRSQVLVDRDVGRDVRRQGQRVCSLSA